MFLLFFTLVFSEDLVYIPPPEAGPIASEYFSLLPDEAFSYSDLGALHIYTPEGDLERSIDPREIEGFENAIITMHSYLPSLGLFVFGLDLFGPADNTFRVVFFDRDGVHRAFGHNPSLNNPLNADFRQVFEVDGTFFVNVYHHANDENVLREVDLDMALEEGSIRFDYTGRSIDKSHIIEKTPTRSMFSRHFLVSNEKGDNYLLFNELDGMFYAFDRHTLRHNRFTDSFQLQGGKRVGVAYHLDPSEVKQRTLKRWTDSFTSNVGVFRLRNEDNLIVCTKNPNPDHPYYGKEGSSIAEDVPTFVLKIESFSGTEGRKNGGMIEIPGGFLLGATDTVVKVLAPTETMGMYEILSFSAP